MSRQGRHSDPADRRAAPLLDESIARVREAMLAQAAEAVAGVDWRLAASALDALESRIKNDSHAEGGAPRRGLVPSTENFYVAVVSIDRGLGYREDLGPAETERVLTELTARISAIANTRPGRMSRSRVELGVLAENEAAAAASLKALQAILETPLKVAGQTLSLETTIGFAGGEGTSAVAILVDEAELALQKAHARHLKIASLSRADHEQRMQRARLARDIRRAPEAGELFLCYQPKLSLRSGLIEGAEALLRWRHPERGLVPPDDFIGVAEEIDEIRPLTVFVLHQVLADIAALGKAAPGRISMNLSGRLIADEDFARWIVHEIGDRGGRLCFEITETAVFTDPDPAMANIDLFAKAGAHISIDDYGSGLSSLSYLKQIPAQELKIDRAFVANLTSSQRDPLLVRSSIDLAHALEMEVTAEGVDDPMALALLKVMGCDHVQGFEVAQPLALPAFKAFLESFAPAVPASPARKAQ